jgi:beta-lactamase class A
MAAVITAIASGEGVSDDSRRQMLSLLLQEGYRDGIPGGVPAGTAAAHKTGSFGQATHDVAIVWGPAGPYAIAVLSDQPDNWGSIARISSAVWDYFAANP